jgi:hypothetical protein
LLRDKTRFARAMNNSGNDIRPMLLYAVASSLQVDGGCPGMAQEDRSIVRKANVA